MTRITLTFPAGFLTDSMVQTPGAGGGVDSKKVIHHFPLKEVICDEATQAASTTRLVYTIRGSYGYLTQFSAMFKTAATGADRTISIDLQRTRSGTTTSVLASPIAITNDTTALTILTASFASQKTQPGDVFEIIITVAGSSGNQALGLSCWLWLKESET